MVAELVIASRHTRHRVTLADGPITVGTAAENNIVLADDPTVSHLHAVLERFGAGWCLNDLDSSNGTWINGERAWNRHRLRDGDDIRIGHTQLVFRDSDECHPPTEVDDVPPTITARERDVLVALCRPVLARDMFTEPATVKAIAAELSVSEAAVKQHLTNLFAKFGIPSADEHRRMRLANDAIRRGAVSIADLRANTT